jgi:hypothetical protein
MEKLHLMGVKLFNEFMNMYHFINVIIEGHFSFKQDEHSNSIKELYFKSYLGAHIQ